MKPSSTMRRKAFGLGGAPSTFQRLIDTVLAELKWKDCLVYIEDVLIFGTSVKDSHNKFERVFDPWEIARLTLNLKKSFFGSFHITLTSRTSY